MMRDQSVRSLIIGIVVGGLLSAAIAWLLIGKKGANHSTPPESRTGDPEVLHRDSKASNRTARDRAESRRNPTLTGSGQRGGDNGGSSFRSRADRVLDESDAMKRRSLIGDLIREWAAEEPDLCLEWASGLENIGDKCAALGVVAGVLLQGDARQRELAFELVNGTANGVLKDGVIVYNFSGYLDVDPQRALMLAKHLSGSGARISVARDLATSEYGKTKSGELMDTLAMGEFRNFFGAEVVKSIAREDPIGALAWLNDYSDFDGSRNSYPAIARELARVDPVNGMEVCAVVPDNKLRKEMLAAIGSEWVREEPAAAGKWLIGQLESGSSAAAKVDESVLTSIVEGWVQWDHAAVFQELEQMDEGAGKRSLKLVALQSLAMFDGARAAKLLWEEPGIEAGERVDLVSSIVHNWLCNNSIEASQWVVDLPAGPERDCAIREVVEEIMTKDRDAKLALEWAQEIQDLRIREEVVAEMEDLEKQHSH